MRMSGEAMILAHLQAVNAQMERINGRLDDLSKEGSERGRRLWEEVNQQGKTLVSISHRMEAVEKGVAGAKPTLDEYAELKAKAVGAGWLGRKLWLVGSGLLVAASWLYSVRDSIWHWLAGK